MDRIEAVETALLHLAQEDAAKDLVLSAIIAAHPDPKLLRAALQAALEANELKASDVGFQRQWAPEQVQALNAGIRPIVERWLRRVPAA